MKQRNRKKTEKSVKRKRTGRYMSICLSVAMLSGTALWGLGVMESFAEDEPETRTETQEAIEKEYPNLLASPDADGEMVKEETAYVVMDADGNVTDTSVTEWLRNGKSQDKISDVSILKDIENTANDKTFTQDGNKLVWDAGGADIKYKGSTDKELPVKVNVSYYLDGQKMSASEIAGQKGHVEIRFSYKVNDSVESGGYIFKTPFTMASGVLLDDEHFTDIEVEGGKVIDDGSKCVCLGIAFPNLKSNLNTDISALDIPESVSIKAYTDKFEIDGTYTVALSGMFEDMDLSDTGSVQDKMNELKGAMNQLSSASNQLVSGASELADGAATLDSKAGELKAGAGSLSSGSAELSSGAKSLSDGSVQLAQGTQKALAGTKSLKDGTGALKSGSSDLADGTSQLKEGSATLSTGTSQLKEGSASLSEGTGALKEGSANLAEGSGQLKAGTDALAQGAAALEEGYGQIKEGMTSLDMGLQSLSSEGSNGSAIVGASDAYQARMEKYAAAMDAMIKAETDEATKAKLQELRNQLPMPDQYTSAVKGYVDGVDSAYAGEQQVSGGLDQLGSKLTALKEGIIGVQSGAADLDNGAKALAQGASDADDGAKALAQGASDADDGAKALAQGASYADDGAAKLKAGAKDLDDGAAALNKGASDLNSGASNLKDGAGKLQAGADELSSGAGQLADGTAEFKKGTAKLAGGAETLYDGMYAFNRDGIQKLVSSLSEMDIDNIIARLNALSDASAKADFIGGKADDMKGESKIIFKSGAVKAQ
jgi:putative membrane protein